MLAIALIGFAALALRMWALGLGCLAGCILTNTGSFFLLNVYGGDLNPLFLPI